jgi:hypothetical protein
MLTLVLKSIYIFIISLIFAIVEVQIEGAHGWAAKLPTWRPIPSKWYARAYKKLMSGKELTGYHLSVISFLMLVFHLPFFFGLKWNISKELDILSIFSLFVVVWDYLWFVVNPKFTIKNFKGDHIFWHSKWFLKLPIDYWFLCGISLFIAIINYLIFNENYIKEWLVIFFLLLVFTIITKWFIKTFKPEWE